CRACNTSASDLRTQSPCLAKAGRTSSVRIGTAEDFRFHICRQPAIRLAESGPEIRNKAPRCRVFKGGAGGWLRRGSGETVCPGQRAPDCPYWCSLLTERGALSLNVRTGRKATMKESNS